MLSVLGWRIEGSFPDVPKAVIIAAPHTSNWDGAITLATVLALRLRLSWMGKDSMFRWPFGRLLRWMGGIPIDRTGTRGVVQASIDTFRTNESLLMVIAPEGTRAAVAGEWKLGFYHIASGAGVPVVLGFIDFAHKAIGFGEMLLPTGDAAADLKKIRAFYDGKVPRHASRFEKSRSGKQE